MDRKAADEEDDADVRHLLMVCRLRLTLFRTRRCGSQYLTHNRGCLLAGGRGVMSTAAVQSTCTQPESSSPGMMDALCRLPINTVGVVRRVICSRSV